MSITTPHGPCWSRLPRPAPRVDPEPTGPSPRIRPPHPRVRAEGPSVSANSRDSSSGYIGASTRRKIAYAHSLGKPIRYTHTPAPRTVTPSDR